jgi:hypothetical protein
VHGGQARGEERGRDQDGGQAVHQKVRVECTLPFRRRNQLMRS